jgi:hypothetical protein
VSDGNPLENRGKSGVELYGQALITSLQEVFQSAMEWLGKLPEEAQTQAIARISHDLDCLRRDVEMGEDYASLSPSPSYIMEASPSYSPPYSPMDDIHWHSTDSHMEKSSIHEEPEVIDVSSDSDNE